MILKPLTVCCVLKHMVILSMLRLAYSSIRLRRLADASDNGVEMSHFHLDLFPPVITWLPIGDYHDVHINCSSCSSVATSRVERDDVDQSAPVSSTVVTGTSTSEDEYLNDTYTAKSTQIYENITYIAWIMSQNAKIANPVGADHIVRPYSNRTDQILLYIHPNSLSVFSVEALHVGHAILLIRVYAYTGDIWWPDDVIDEDIFDTMDVLSIMEYRVTVIRRNRMVDVAFNCVIAVVSVLNSFSMGLCSDWASLRMHIKHPAAMLLGLSCQFLLNPIMALAIAKALVLPHKEGLGLFYIACVPGGGMGHIINAIMDGDKALDISLNFFSTIIAVGTAPLWIFSMGRFLGLSDHVLVTLYEFEIWLAASAALYLVGVLVNHTRPGVSEAILNWLIKPFLLLFTLVFITLGVYINIYMFTILDFSIPIAAGTLPFLGYFIGMLIAYLSRQENEYLKTISIETTMTNCFLVLTMVRYSLPQPDADITSVMPMWVIMMTPIPFFLTYIFQYLKQTIGRKCARRKEKQYRHFSIVSSLLNVTNVTNLSSSITPKMNSPCEDNTILIDEKVTVL